MNNANKNPEQIARDAIDARLAASGWSVQGNKEIDFSAGPGVAVRDYPSSVGPADYALFADRRALGVAEAKPDSWGAKITTVEELIERDKASLDLFWLKDKSLTDLDNLPDPDVLAEEIIENLEAGLESLRSVLGALRSPAQDREVPDLARG